MFNLVEINTQLRKSPTPCPIKNLGVFKDWVSVQKIGMTKKGEKLLNFGSTFTEETQS